MRRMLPATLFVATATVIAAGCGGGSGSGSGGYANAGSDTTTTTAGGASGTLSGSVGPGFDISMDKTTVAAGTYTFVCDPHSSSMKGTLTVT